MPDERASDENKQDNDAFDRFFQKVSYLYKQKHSKSMTELTQKQVWNLLTLIKEGTIIALVGSVWWLLVYFLNKFHMLLYCLHFVHEN